MASISTADALKNYSLWDGRLFIVGTLDDGVTVLSQQVRALNLVWALVESEMLPPIWSTKPTIRVAVVGSGVSGLTVAGGLLKKWAKVELTIFEERDALLPLQQGSDSRWLHPNIYNWPDEGSVISTAMLPVLNWTAARASDVVVQMLSEWANILSDTAERLKSNGLQFDPPTLYCNAQHLRIDTLTSKTLRIDWVGERRDPKDGTTGNDGVRVGGSKEFDLVILAVGFGLDGNNKKSYWRNETIGQPSLDKARRVYLVSGQGDGALIDLLRLRISQFRQDRILNELFTGSRALLRKCIALRAQFADGDPGIFDAFEALASNEATEFERLMKNVERRLRRDTEAILHLKSPNPTLSEMYDVRAKRISFQNKLLTYLLYKCGGFIPSTQSEKELVEKFSIDNDCIVLRHGPKRLQHLQRVLSAPLFTLLKQREKEGSLRQSDRPVWVGGYFGIPGLESDAVSRFDKLKLSWRKEYLPGATSLLGAAFCSTMAGMIQRMHPSGERLRVTLHRAVLFGTEEVLQQVCEYEGINIDYSERAAGRTFPAENATIGLAYKTRQIIRSRKGVHPPDLKRAMDQLNLNVASSKMSEKVGFVLAIPLLEPNASFTRPTPVAGIIYIDSAAEGFFLEDAELQTMVSTAQQFLDSMVRSKFDRVRNERIREPDATNPPPKASVPDFVKAELDMVEAILPPVASEAFQFNFDYSDFSSIY